MAVAAVPRPLTWEDLEATPESGHRYEIMQGELVVAASPGGPHQLAATWLAVIVAPHVYERKLGVFYGSPVDVRFDLHNVVAPDLTFVSEARRHIITPHYIDGVPDLVMEILSKSTRRYDLVQKAALYETAGVREYWQIDTDARTIVILSLQDGRHVPLPVRDGRVRSDVLDGLEIDLAEFFAKVF
ncbi:MAG TPA: Uma2 family endonuclease [Thermomicrobiales bacterium]|jgi:Uma2 family endonuclease